MRLTLIGSPSLKHKFGKDFQLLATIIDKTLGKLEGSITFVFCDDTDFNDL